MSVAGAFYPDDAQEIKRFFEHFESILSTNNIDIPASKIVIVPHAGYVYSGFSANIAYKALKKSGIKKFVVIGPSHRIGFSGASLCGFEAYKTPFGELKAAHQMQERLRDYFSLNCITQAHMEHSTEVQFPFLKYYIDDAQIIEIVYSDAQPSNISEIIDYVLKEDDWGVVISTDLSHFYDQKDANTLDAICVEAVANLDISKLKSGCEACGIIGVEAMLMSAKKLGLRAQILDYRTSADASGDESRVVGYLSVCFV
jgi:AmmeMemoRadiSam system protein B